MRLEFNLKACSCAVKKTSTSLTVSIQVSVAIAIVVQTVEISIAVTYILNQYMGSLRDLVWLLIKTLVFVILLSIFVLIPVSLRAHSRSLMLTPIHSH